MAKSSLPSRVPLPIKERFVNIHLTTSLSLWSETTTAVAARSCGATAATLVVSFVMLAAFAFVYSATACGHPDVYLWSTLQHLAGVLNYINVFDGVCA